MYSYLHKLEKNIAVSRIKIYEDESCLIEPCLNYQRCVVNAKFSQASSKYIYSSSIQFRPIHVKYDFSCTCVTGFTGTVNSINCDLEINLCYSNPCGQNGVCISLESDYYCICDRNFIGRNCEHNLKTLKCCDLTSTIVRDTNNTNECQELQTKTDIDSFNLLTQQRICKTSNAECKNGNVITCEKCAQNSNNAIYYNKFCELRSRHFPPDKNAFIIVPGIKSRMRFKVKLTFATIKPNGHLFYNGRLDSFSHDFISLEIQNSKLVFSYSLGDSQPNVIRLDNAFDMSDGKWHTVTLNYANRNFTLSVDNDNNEEINACDLAHNQSALCFKTRFTHTLSEKCTNPFESCFRYFDLNGPFQIGRSSFEAKGNKNYFEGCISSLNINEKVIDLNDDNIFNFNTEIGCKPKSDQICKTSIAQMCDKCESMWNDKIKCSCRSNNYIESSYCKLKLTQNIFSFKSNGYLFISEDLKEDSNNLKIEFYVKQKISRVLLDDFVIFYLDLESSSLKLKYSMLNKSLSLMNDNLKLIDMPYSTLMDGYWHKISIDINKNASIFLILNDLYNRNINYNKNLLFGKKFAKWFIGGSVDSHELGIDGCVKEVQRDLYRLTFKIINGTETCEVQEQSSVNQSSNNICGLTQTESPCFNNGVCQVSSNSNQFNCSCLEGFKGDYCQHATINSMRLISDKTSLSCPAKWWGKDPTICGPCDCDESLNFSPDCNKSNGKCECKSKYYKKRDPITKKEYCAPCDCYLEGSSSLQCQPYTGQCSCLKESGITGRRCDSCMSPFAEIVTNKGVAVCQILSNSECPKTFFNNIWWSRTIFNTIANSSCPKGAIGLAYRHCNETIGWSSFTDLLNCRSKKFYNMELIKWHDELMENKSELNSYQAIKLAENLNRVTEEAESDEFNEDFEIDTDSGEILLTVNYLYANDLVIIKRLAIFLTKFDIENAPSFLYIQDKYYLKNFFSTVNRLFSKKYEKHWQNLKPNESIVDLLFAIDKYLNCLLEYNYQYQQSILNEININLDNLQVYMNSASQFIQHEEQKLSRSIKLKVTNENQTTDDSSLSNAHISYLTLKNLPRTLPTRLLLNNDAHRQLVNFEVASDIIMLNVHKNNAQNDKNNTFNAIIEFKIKFVNRLSSALVKNLYCVYLNEEKQLWSTYGAKIISTDTDKNTIKCLYNHFSIYSVMMPINYSNLITVPVPFSVATYTFTSISLLILALTNILLISLRKLNTALTIIYTNFCFNLFLLQLTFISGVNNTSNSTVLCKLVAVFLHYLHISTYLWLLIIALHLYRMLTELRDINKIGSKAPAFYYVIAYVIPSILSSLSLGIKQDLYTSSFFTNSISIYCWLNVANIYDIFYALFLPIIIIILFAFFFILMSYKETLRKTFKQTDVSLVRYSMISLLVLLALHSFLITCIYLQLSSLNNRMNLFIIYENLYLFLSLVYSIVIVFLFLICDRYTKLHIYKNIIKKLMGKSGFLDESLSASKANLCAKSPYNNNINRAKVSKDLVDVNTKYMIDYRCDNKKQSNSISTTTTTGTLDNIDNLDDLVNDLNIGTSMIISDNNPGRYNIASLGYTTTFSTDTTTNGSDINYRIDFNTQTLSPQSSSLSTTPSLSSACISKANSNKVRNCDIIDVSKVLKGRENSNRHSPKISKTTNLIVNDESIHETRSCRVKNSVNFSMETPMQVDEEDICILPESQSFTSFEKRSKRNDNTKSNNLKAGKNSIINIR